MSTERSNRDRGSLFENKEKRKPSQPDMQGDCSLGGAPYEIRAWRREDQLTVTVAPPRKDQNTYPPDAFRGALDKVDAPKGKRGAEDEPTPAWSGEIEGDEARYLVRAFEKQGKSGSYLTLGFERLEKIKAPTPEFEWETQSTDDEDDDEGESADSAY